MKPVRDIAASAKPFSWQTPTKLVLFVFVLSLPAIFVVARRMYRHAMATSRQRAEQVAQAEALRTEMKAAATFHVKTEAFFDALEHIQAAIEIGINMDDYTEKLQTANYEYRKCSDNLSPDEEFAYSSWWGLLLTLDAYASALSAWQNASRAGLPRRDRNEVLTELPPKIREQFEQLLKDLTTKTIARGGPDIPTWATTAAEAVLRHGRAWHWPADAATAYWSEQQQLQWATASTSFAQAKRDRKAEREGTTP